MANITKCIIQIACNKILIIVYNRNGLQHNIIFERRSKRPHAYRVSYIYIRFILANLVRRGSPKWVICLSRLQTFIYRNPFSASVGAQCTTHIPPSHSPVHKINGCGCYYNIIIYNLCGRSFRICRHRCGCRGCVMYFRLTGQH